MFNFWWLAGLVDGLKPHPPPISSQKNEMLVFALRSTSHDRPGWLMDSNLICHLLPAKKIKCPFLDYVQIVMIGRAGWWTWTLSTTPLQPKKIKCSFLDYIQIVMISRAGWWTQTLIRHPSPAKKIKCSFLHYVQLLMIGRASRWTRTCLPSLSSQ